LRGDNRTDGEKWERVGRPTPCVEGHPADGSLEGDKVLALTDAGLYVVGMLGWEKAVIAGMPKKTGNRGGNLAGGRPTPGPPRVPGRLSGFPGSAVPVMSDTR